MEKCVSPVSTVRDTQYRGAFRTLGGYHLLNLIAARDVMITYTMGVFNTVEVLK